MPDIAENLAQVQQRITAACNRAGRSHEEVQLVAVGKKFTAEVIREAADCGLTLFGENRVQEAKAKIPDCPGHLRWHFIGNLQTNKCRDAIMLFDMLHAFFVFVFSRVDRGGRCKAWAQGHQGWPSRGSRCSVMGST